MDQITDLTEEQLAADPRNEMWRLAFEFLLQQEYFGIAATMVAEFIATIQRIQQMCGAGRFRFQRMLLAPQRRSAFR